MGCSGFYCLILLCVVWFCRCVATGGFEVVQLINV